MLHVQFILGIKINIYCNLMVPLEGIIGKPVKIRYGPAAVIGDEPRNVPLPGTQMLECRMGRRG
jgi:hypothetical protein